MLIFKRFLISTVFLSSSLKATAAIFDVSLQEDLDRQTRSQLVQVESLQLLQNGKSATAFLDIANHAQKYLYLNFLSFTCDEATEPLVQVLKSKAAAAVEVRLITNQFFAPLSYSCLKDLSEAGVKVLKVRTHSSYMVNDQKELLIGSQSVARMFFNSDGNNHLDRDMMLFAKGPLATDALKDFDSIWYDERSEGPISDEDRKDILDHQVMAQNEDFQGLRGTELYLNLAAGKNLCRFLSENPRLSLSDIQIFWRVLASGVQKSILFSGVKVQIEDQRLGQILKEKSNQGISVNYIGNGDTSGNGELTMVLSEWIQALHEKNLSWLASLFEAVKEWDSQRVARESAWQYHLLKSNSKISVYAHPQFIHHKVWLFDDSAAYVGSPNLDEDKFGKLHEAGVVCWDKKLAADLKESLATDQKAGVIYE